MVATTQSSITLDPPDTQERERGTGPGSGLGGSWNVIVLNDDHNTFEGVARALSRTLPGVTYEQGMGFANTIHNTGRAIVWTGPNEPAEHYREQLKAAGLTMAPLEQH
ncbi:MAG: ATP-dependent Clp protease adaptor ClpS [Solirubrobacterales bacterium]